MLSVNTNAKDNGHVAVDDLSPLSPPPGANHGKTRTVLIALDHSNHSAYAFDWAKTNLLSAETDLVVLVNVRPIAISHASFYEDLGAMVRDVEEENRQSSHRLLQHYGFDLKRAGFTVRAISIRGDTRSDVVRKAQELHATVIVCGSRGLGTLQRALLGSVSTYIVNNAQCPTLVIRPPPDHELVKTGTGAEPVEVKACPEAAKVRVDSVESSSAGAQRADAPLISKGSKQDEMVTPATAAT